MQEPLIDTEPCSALGPNQNCLALCLEPCSTAKSLHRRLVQTTKEAAHKGSKGSAQPKGDDIKRFEMKKTDRRKFLGGPVARTGSSATGLCLSPG